jgi:hypothetical protein
MSRLLPIAILVLLFAHLAEGAEVKVEGVLKAVDAKERTLTVEKKTAKGTKELALEVAEEAGDLASLKVGDEVSLAYDSTLEVVTKIGGGVGVDGRGKGRNKPVCRVTLQVGSDGTFSGRIASATEESVPDDSAGIPKKVGEGLWRVVHTFPNADSCKPYRVFLDRKIAEYSRSHKALVLPPPEMTNDWASVVFPLRFRLPVTVVADVEAVEEKAQVTVSLYAPPTDMNVVKSVETKVVTEDAFRTNVFCGLFFTRDNKQGSKPSMEEFFTEREVALDQGSRFEGKRHPTIELSPASAMSAACASNIGVQRLWQGIRLKRFEVAGRLAPWLGVQIKEDGDGVFVEKVFPNTLANNAGLKAGDRVVAVGGKPASGLARTMQLLAVTELGDTWDLEIVRGGEKKVLSIKCELP